MINKTEIGKKIQLKRNDMNITQEKLAEIVEISTNYLSKVERGLNSPSAENFLKIVQALNLSLEDFGIIPQANINIHKSELLKIIYDCDHQKIEALLPVVKCILESFKNIKQKY
jgi:transcriptional regulator with XRE-family HTH domain